MKTILVATDFSTRSDRACRRARLIAEEYSANIVLLHVINDDQPVSMRKTMEREAAALLGDMVDSIKDQDRFECDFKVLSGEPSQLIAEKADELDAELVVMGPHRRQLFRDILIGTTVERTIRQIQRPVLVANSTPGKSYSRILIATDFSDRSRTTVETVRSLGFLDRTECVVLNVFDTPAQSLMKRAMQPRENIETYIGEEEDEARRGLDYFVRETGLEPGLALVRKLEQSVSDAILRAAEENHTDLVVVGTHGRTGPTKFLLGSVAEETLRDCELDILVVPSRSG